MKRRILSILIAGILILSNCSVIAGASPVIGDITFIAGGEPVNELLPGETISASVTAQQIAVGDKAMFALILYRGGAMEDIDADVITLSEELPITLETELTIPEDVFDCRLEAVLWDGIDTIKPLCTTAVFPSSETGLKSITADGVAIEDFDPEVTEYNVAIDATASSSPEIVASKMDGSSVVSVKTTRTFPGKSIVTVKSNDGSETEYTLNFVAEDTDSLISNFDFEDCVLKRNFKEGAVAYTGETNADYVNVIGNLEGAAYIAPKDSSAGIDGSFTLKRTAEVKVFTNESPDLGEGWEEDSLTSVQRYRAVDGENPGYGIYDEFGTVYTKTVVVEGEPVDVVLSDLGAGSLVTINFVYDEICGEEIPVEIPRVTNLQYHGPTNENGNIAANTHPQYATGLDNGSVVYTNYDLVASNLLEEFVGEDYIRVQNPIASGNPANTKSAWYGSTMTWITFEVRQNVTIRAFTNGKIDALTWAGGFTDATTENTVYVERCNPTNGSSVAYDRMYTKYVEASEDAPVKVSIPNGAFTFASKWAYILTLDFE